MKNNGHTRLYSMIATLLLSLCICMPVFFVTSLKANAATYGYSTWTASNGLASIRYPVMTQMEGEPLYENLILEGFHHSISYPIYFNYDPSGTSNRYLRGYFSLDIYLPVSIGNNFSLSNIKNFQFHFDSEIFNDGFFTCGRPSLIQTNDGLNFHFSLYGFFGNLWMRDILDISIGTLYFDFVIEDDLTGQGRYIDINVPSITENVFSVTATATPYEVGNFKIIADAVATAINSAADIDTVISLLNSAVQYNEDIFNELTYIYSTNQNIYTRLGLILEFLQDWQYQTDTEMQDILEELAEVVETNRDIISQLPVFDWDDYGTDISDLYAFWDNVVRPASPTTRDNNLVWSWLGLTWPVYIIGLVLIMGTISFILYGKK